MVAAPDAALIEPLFQIVPIVGMNAPFPGRVSAQIVPILGTRLNFNRDPAGALAKSGEKAPTFAAEARIPVPCRNLRSI
jgi:hypothetical protein